MQTKTKFRYFLSFLVVQPIYEIDVFKENVMIGNDALFKCQIPSFVSDLVNIDSWIDSEGIEIRMNSVLGKDPLPLKKNVLVVILVKEYNNHLNTGHSNTRQAQTQCTHIFLGMFGTGSTSDLLNTGIEIVTVF